MTTNDDLRDIIEEVRRDMAAVAEQIKGQDRRMNNHGDRIGALESTTADMRVTGAEFRASADATSSLKRWMATFIVSALVLGIGALALLLNLLKAIHEMKEVK